MKTVLRVHWCRWANRTGIARDATCPDTTKAQLRRITPLSWAFLYGADDGNRTRVFSLGS